MILNYKKSIQYPLLLVSSDGETIIHTDTGEVLKIHTLKSGYKAIYFNGKPVLVHRLVAFAHLGTPTMEDPVVDHLDMNKANNRVDNLEWVTRGENTRRSRNQIVRLYGNIESLKQKHGIKKLNQILEKIRREF